MAVPYQQRLYIITRFQTIVKQKYGIFYKNIKKFLSALSPDFLSAKLIPYKARIFPFPAFLAPLCNWNYESGRLTLPLARMSTARPREILHFVQNDSTRTVRTNCMRRLKNADFAAKNKEHRHFIAHALFCLLKPFKGAYNSFKPPLSFY